MQLPVVVKFESPTKYVMLIASASAREGKIAAVLDRVGEVVQPCLAVVRLVSDGWPELNVLVVFFDVV